MSVVEVTSPGTAEIPAVTESDEISRILELAAELLEREGWFAGGAGAPRRCAAQAIDAVCRNATLSSKAIERFSRAIAHHIAGDDSPHQLVFLWNDSQKSGEAVCRKLREVAANDK